MKVLIIRLSSIGDIVLTTPVIRCLKQQASDSELHFICKNAFREIVESNPHVKKVWIYEEEKANGFMDLKKEQFDLALDLHRNLRTSEIKGKINATNTEFYKANKEKWLATALGIDLLPKGHIVDRYMNAIPSELGVSNDGKGLDFFFVKDLDFNLEDHDLIEGQYTVISIGAKHEGKKQSPEKMGEWLQELKTPAVLIGGKEDEARANALGSVKGVINLVGKLSIQQSAFVISKCKMVIGFDTGMMHITSALKKKLIVLWGCTTPSLGMYSYQDTSNYIDVQPEKLKLRPCSKLGDHCKYDPKCIDQIKKASVMEAIETLSLS